MARLPAVPIVTQVEFPEYDLFGMTCTVTNYVNIPDASYVTWVAFDGDVGKAKLKFILNPSEFRHAKPTGRTLIRHVKEYKHGFPDGITWSVKPEILVQGDARHPMQPVVLDADGRPRFKPNALVEYLLDAGGRYGLDMNHLALLPNIPQEDREQFAQLIGYSVTGFGELPYASDETYAKADRMALELKSRFEK